jgi:PAS domain S-box-containing protein
MGRGPEVNTGSRILIVGDESHVQQATARLLQTEGFQVMAATVPGDGLRMAAEQKPDLVLLHASLQDMDALEACRLIKADKSLSSTCLLLISDKVLSPADQARGLEAGADGYIVHPISDHELLARVQDTLRLHRANRALRQSEEHFRALFQYASDLVSIVDADGVMRYASPSHEAVLGYPPDQLIGNNMMAFLHPDDLPHVQEVLSQVLREPELKASVRFRFRHRNGSWRWLESTGRSLIDNPAIAGVVANSRDVTEQVEVVEALHKLREELELRVQERTAKLDRANEALRAEIVEHKRAQEEIERSHRRESTLNALLRISMEDITLDEQLERALDEILSIAWLPVQQQGAIFLLPDGESGTLELRVHRGLGSAFQMACARVDMGRCLCGRAAASGKIQFSACVDERHEIEYEGMIPHGHYCVPIQSRERVLGTLVLYVDEGKQRNWQEEEFLGAVAHTLAGIVERKRVEEALRDSGQRYRLLAENATDMISRHSPEGIYLYVSPLCRSLLGYEPEELVGRDAYEFFHPEDYAAIRDSHRTILEEPTIYSVGYRIRRKDGSYVWVESNSKTIRDPVTDQVVEIIAITRDITRRKQAQEALQQSQRQLQELYAQLEEHSRTLEDRVAERTHEIERRQRVAESLRGMLAVLNSDLPLDEILDHIVAEARRLLGSDTSAIYRLAGPYNSLAVQTVQGLAAQEIATLDLPIELSQELRYGRPVAVPDVVAVAQDSSLLVSLGSLACCARALLAVPLNVQGQVYGGLVLFYSEPRLVSEDEIDLAVAFADQAALAIENAGLHQQVKEAAVMEERARLARELHDSVTQALFSMTLLAEAGSRLAGAGDLERTQAYLDRLGETSQQSLKEMRLLVYELRPPVLEKQGLAGALQQRLDAVEARAGVEARLRLEGKIQVPVPVEEDLYRIAEQALNNTLKHAAATFVQVQIRGDGEGTLLEVVDNGCGFDPRAIQGGGGQGLISMRERAARIGGRLTVDSMPGQGTTVRVYVPARSDRRRPAVLKPQKR